MASAGQRGTGRLVPPEREAGTFSSAAGSRHAGRATSRNDRFTCLEEAPMHGIIYIVGLIVVIMFILSFLGLR
jgi:hypothetical protein